MGYTGKYIQHTARVVPLRVGMKPRGSITAAPAGGETPRIDVCHAHPFSQFRRLIWQSDDFKLNKTSLEVNSPTAIGKGRMLRGIFESRFKFEKFKVLSINDIFGRTTIHESLRMVIRIRGWAHKKSIEGIRGRNRLDEELYRVDALDT